MRRITVIHFPDIRAWLILLFMLAVLTTISLLPGPEATPALAPALFGQSIIIDPGHGGFDPGMVGVTGANEAAINLAIALKLAQYCSKAGAEVTLTCESDSALAGNKSDDLRERVNMTRVAETDIFISLHCNSFVSGRWPGRCFPASININR